MSQLTAKQYGALLQFRFEIRKFLAFSEAASREVGLEPKQHQLLLVLKGLPREERPTIGTLSRWLVVRHHTAVELVTRSEKQGLVTKTADDDDRRTILVRVTAEGEQMLERLSKVHRKEVRSLAPKLVGVLSELSGGAA